MNFLNNKYSIINKQSVLLLGYLIADSHKNIKEVEKKKNETTC